MGKMSMQVIDLHIPEKMLVGHIPCLEEVFESCGFPGPGKSSPCYGKRLGIPSRYLAGKSEIGWEQGQKISHKMGWQIMYGSFYLFDGIMAEIFPWFAHRKNYNSKSLLLQPQYFVGDKGLGNTRIAFEYISQNGFTVIH